MLNSIIMRVGIIQQTNSSNRDENIFRLTEKVRELARGGAQLIVMQELHNSLYFCQTENPAMFDLAETIPGPSSALFGSLAKELGLVILLSLFEKRASGLYHNSAVVIEKDGSIAGIYRKMHIPDDPGYYEKFYFAPGDLGFGAIRSSVGRLGLLICWDQWYPEAARLSAMSGAELLIYPTAIGRESTDTIEEQQRQLDAWITIQRSHAIANGIPVIAVNRTGYEPDPSGLTGGIRFWGNSFVCGAQGEFLYRAGEEEQIQIVEIDSSKTENVRRWWPFFRDRRIDSYSDLTRRWIDK